MGLEHTGESLASMEILTFSSCLVHGATWEIPLLPYFAVSYLSGSFACPFCLGVSDWIFSSGIGFDASYLMMRLSPCLWPSSPWRLPSALDFLAPPHGFGGEAGLDFGTKH